MNNPYEILGVSPNASDEEVKAAYRELVKKYHPDKYQDNPLSGLAQEKLQEVNEAYDEIVRIRQGNFSGSSQSTQSYSSSQSGSDPRFAQIRRDLDNGNIAAAEAALYSMQVRNAEWVFLNGMLSYKKGYYDDAIVNVQQACSMEPSNAEYRSVLNRLSGMGSGYARQSYGRGYGNTDDLLCTACQCYCCGDIAGCW